MSELKFEISVTHIALDTPLSARLDTAHNARVLCCGRMPAEFVRACNIWVRCFAKSTHWCCVSHYAMSTFWKSLRLFVDPGAVPRCRIKAWGTVFCGTSNARRSCCMSLISMGFNCLRTPLTSVPRYAQPVSWGYHIVRNTAHLANRLSYSADYYNPNTSVSYQLKVTLYNEHQ